MSVHSTSGVVAFSDTDASGRFHHTAAYRWAENTEHAFYRSVLPDVDIGRFPRRSTSATYERPLTAGDAYTVNLELDRIGNSSITYTWTVTGPAGVCVRGAHAVVHVDATGRPAPVPGALRDHLAPAAGVVA
ncbi:thioesterase family protein [Streptomyces sp. NPDC046924]|uniref:acyl-CoA thioesterase n=1 Tax=Streptomyces sp. NPDC046924 TaxID=3155136 RepID=UPI0033EC1DC6